MNTYQCECGSCNFLCVATVRNQVDRCTIYVDDDGVHVEEWGKSIDCGEIVEQSFECLECGKQVDE